MPKTPLEWVAFVITLATVLLLQGAFEGWARWWWCCVPIPATFAGIWLWVWIPGLLELRRLRRGKR